VANPVKILVFAHKMEVGGSQTNTIELTAALRDVHGHDVVLFATPGPMVEVAQDRGLHFIPAPCRTSIPSLPMMRALREVVRSERPDLVHVWEWWQCIDAFYTLHLMEQVPMLVSYMLSDELTRFLPKTPLTTFGTPEFVDRAKAAGRRRARLLVPPVDLNLNKPDVVDPRPFRERYSIESNDLVLVTVSRLAAFLKGESLRRTIDAVRVLGRDLPLRLIIVGDGDARKALERLAAEANREIGRRAVIFTGELLDPRSAYATADIVVGMGGSALRGMAFGRPVIIVGEQGFSSPLTPETADSLYYYGMYGIGDGNPSNTRLINQIRSLTESRDTLPGLGIFSRRFVTAHFSLESVCAQLEKYCQAAVVERQRPLVAVADGLRSAALIQFRKYTPDYIRQLVKIYELKKMSALPSSPRNDLLKRKLG
jgi:glycosyltransferase involved in cell wall biosynthesis